MNRFAELLDRLSYTPGRNDKLALIVDYFRHVPDPDRGYALAAMTGTLDFKHAKPAMIRGLIEERADPALFRWVATAANRYRFGALSAYVRDDGLVNLNFAYSTPYDALTDDTLRACVLPVVFTAGDLHREAVTLFSEG